MAETDEWKNAHPSDDTLKGSDALGTAKQSQVRAMARSYLAEESDRPRVANLRFDAIGVVIDARGRLARLDHLEGAF